VALGVDKQGESCDLRIGLEELKSRITFTQRKFRGFETNTGAEARARGADLVVEMKARLTSAARSQNLAANAVSAGSALVLAGAGRAARALPVPPLPLRPAAAHFRRLFSASRWRCAAALTANRAVRSAAVSPAAAILRGFPRGQPRRMAGTGGAGSVTSGNLWPSALAEGAADVAPFCSSSSNSGRSAASGRAATRICKAVVAG
jgi:hypothetical protein